MLYPQVLFKNDFERCRQGVLTLYGPEIWARKTNPYRRRTKSETTDNWHRSRQCEVELKFDMWLSFIIIGRKDKIFLHKEQK